VIPKVSITTVIRRKGIMNGWGVRVCVCVCVYVNCTVIRTNGTSLQKVQKTDKCSQTFKF